MLKVRAIYILFIIITIGLGLLSRKIIWLPLATGDALYAVMVYWGFRFLFIHRTKSIALLLSIVCCFVIEFLQLLQHPVLIEIRTHPFLRLIFGQGFLWTDLLAYSSGATLVYLVDKKIFSLKNNIELRK